MLTMAVQRNARTSPVRVREVPATTSPSAETPFALAVVPPSVPMAWAPISVQRNARWLVRECPTTTEPSADTSVATENPNGCIPVAAVHRKAWNVAGDDVVFKHPPTTTVPSKEAAVAAPSVNPGSMPRSCMPPAAVQRKTRPSPGVNSAWPTTTSPSPDTPLACDLNPPRPRSTIPVT